MKAGRVEKGGSKYSKNKGKGFSGIQTLRHNEGGSVIKMLKNFPMPHLNGVRDIYVYLPPHYDESYKRYYPVIYMQDGQNIFDIGRSDYETWNVEVLLDDLYEKDYGYAFIVVGVCFGKNRDQDYLPWLSGDAYADDMALTVKPYIDANFRTLSGGEYTAIAGSSLGADAALYTGLKYQHIFTKIAAFSLAVEIGYQRKKRALKWAEKEYENVRIYLDIGTEEAESQGVEHITSNDFVHRVEDVYHQLRRAGFSEEEMLLVLDTIHTEHSEEAWNARFVDAICWLYSWMEGGETIIDEDSGESILY